MSEPSGSAPVADRSCLPSSPRRTMSEPLLEVKDLRVSFGGGRDIFFRRKEHFEAVRGVDLKIGKGESFAIVGESGAGKSTVAKCIVGLQAPTAGEVRFEGEL